MQFKDLYEKGLDRKVNPAVSASDLSDDTVLTEIVEYVFTQEIIAILECQNKPRQSRRYMD